MQAYTSGDVCEVDGASVRREAELQLACSVSGQQLVTVQEAPQCRYTVLLFSPELCGLEGFGPLRGPREHVGVMTEVDEEL